VRKVGLVFLAAGLAAAAAWGAFGDILQSFPAPNSYPLALAYENGYLWVYCNTSPYNFYRVNPSNGSVVASFVSPGGSVGRGAAWDGTYLYTGNSTTDYIFRMSTTGSVYGSFGVSNFYGGLTWDHTYLWYTGTSPNYFYRMTTAGSVNSSFSATFYPFDPGSDGTYIYCGTYTPSQQIYKLTTAGSIVESHAPPANYPWGCTHDGTDLWFGTTTGTNYIWRVDDGVLSNVAPASLGKVKALFK